MAYIRGAHTLVFHVYLLTMCVETRHNNTKEQAKYPTILCLVSYSQMTKFILFFDLVEARLVLQEV